MSHIRVSKVERISYRLPASSIHVFFPPLYSHTSGGGISEHMHIPVSPPVFTFKVILQGECGSLPGSHACMKERMTEGKSE